MLARGGSAVDAAIAAQAVIAVVLPQAAGLGGDMLALVYDGGAVSAVNGTGLSPRGLTAAPATSGGTAVTVPGIADGWLTLHARWGRLPLSVVLEPAVRLAADGIEVDGELRAAVDAQRDRLTDGGARGWELLDIAVGGRWQQPELAALLADLATCGREAFYAGRAAAAIAAAVQRCGGALALDDLAAHDTPCPDPIAVQWRTGQVHVQPPTSQGVLLAMALQKAEMQWDSELFGVDHALVDHILIEIVGAAFTARSECAAGAALLDRPLDIDTARASGRTGPRAYLHTAGVAVADGDGHVVSSLISVFDDFGSGVYVPELGIVLNNRAAGFTDGANAAAPGKRPVHTLAPALSVGPDGVTALATPGADGQVQTLLQVLAGSRTGTLVDAVTAPRWRSQDGELLMEESHPAAPSLAARGHRVVTRPDGAGLFGSVVAAGVAETPFAIADWRRQTHCTGVS